MSHLGQGLNVFTAESVDQKRHQMIDELALKAPDAIQLDDRRPVVEKGGVEASPPCAERLSGWRFGI
jgi:hypothetical protein